MNLHFHKYIFHHNGRFLLFDGCMAGTYREQIYKCCICGKLKTRYVREDDE